MRRRTETRDESALAASRNFRRPARPLTALSAFGLGLLLLMRIEAPAAETIRATPRFDAFEGTVASMDRKGGDLTLEVRVGSETRKMSLSGLPEAAREIICDKCSIVSRVQHSPSGPSQVITFFEGDRTIAAVGINTVPGMGVLSPDITRGQETTVRLNSPKSQKPGAAPLRIEAPGLDLPVAAGDKAAFKALDKDWVLYIGSSEIMDSNDVVGQSLPNTLETRTDWLLISQP